MNTFTYEYPVKVHFGKDCVKEHLKEELSKAGNTIMLAYGGGSVSDCCKIVSAQAKLDKDIWEMPDWQRPELKPSKTLS